MAAAMRIRAEFKPATVLSDWRAMMQALPYMNEVELLAAIKKELAQPKIDRRTDIIVRLHRRYSKLRNERELLEYLEN